MDNVLIRLLFAVLINGSVILGISLLLTVSLRWISASVKHHILFAALLSLLLLVPAFIFLPGWNIPQFESGNGLSGLTNFIAGNRESSPFQVTEKGLLAVEAEEQVGETESLPAILGWIAASADSLFIGICLAGSALVLILQLVRWAGAGFVASMARSVQDKKKLELANGIQRTMGIRKKVTLLQSEMAAVTMAWGMKRPCIVLPQDSAEWDAERSRAVLQHELAHVKRNDNLIHLIAVIISAIFWFNPLVWLVLKRLNYEREVACDDQVLTSGTKATSYARHLMELTQRLTGPKNERIAPAVMAHSSNIKRRLLSILDSGVNRRPLGRASAASYLLLIMMLSLPIAAFQPWKLKAQSTDTEEDLVITGRVVPFDYENKRDLYLQLESVAFNPDRPLEFVLIDKYSWLSLHWETADGPVQYQVVKGDRGGRVFYKIVDGRKVPMNKSDHELFESLMARYKRPSEDTGSSSVLRKLGMLALALDKLSNAKISSKHMEFTIEDGQFKYEFTAPDGYFSLEKEINGHQHYYLIKNNPDGVESKIFRKDGVYYPFTKEVEEDLFEILLSIGDLLKYSKED